jgi:hypothetical protein
MLQEFIVQNYLIIQNNVVTNVVLWDGDTTKWTPPAGSIALIQDTTPALVWRLNADNTAYVLTEVIGEGQINYTWDGTLLTTDEPQPPNPPIQSYNTVKTA